MEERSRKELMQDLVESQELKAFVKTSIDNQRVNLPAISNTKVKRFTPALERRSRKAIREITKEWIHFPQPTIKFSTEGLLSNSVYYLQKAYVRGNSYSKTNEKVNKGYKKAIHALLNSLTQNAQNTKQEDEDKRFNYSSIISSNKYKVIID